MGIYKVTAPKPVHDIDPGQTAELDLTAEEESDLVAAGRLELVPRDYRVIGTSKVCDTEPGGTFKHAFTVGQEAALFAGGHIERVDSAPKPKAKASPAPEAPTAPAPEAAATPDTTKEKEG